MHSNRSRLERRNASKDLGIFRLAGCAKSHRVGKNGRAVHAHGNAALKIGRGDQRQFRRSLQPVEQLGGNVRLAPQQHRAVHRHRHHQRSDVILANLVAHLYPSRVGVIQKLRQHLDAEELSDFLFGRHPAQRLVSPLLAALVEMDRPRRQKAVFILILVFTKTKRGCQHQRNQQQMSKHAFDNSKNGWQRPAKLPGNSNFGFDD